MTAEISSCFWKKIHFFSVSAGHVALGNFILLTLCFPVSIGAQLIRRSVWLPSVFIAFIYVCFGDHKVYSFFPKGMQTNILKWSVVLEMDISINETVILKKMQNIRKYWSILEKLSKESLSYLFEN